MANQFTTVTTQGFGSRIMDAIVGVPIGLLLILGGIGLLYWNEGRVDLSKIAKQSVAVDSGQVDASANGKFVSVTGPVKTQQPLGDGAYLQPGQYAAVQRVMEEYAWVESQSSQSQNNTGGSQTTTTTYNYKEEWTDNVADSSTFHDASGHQNPAKPLDDTTAKATSAKVGAYGIDPQTISLPSLQPVSLESSNTIVAATPASTSTPVAPAAPLKNLALADSSYLFSGNGSLGSPQLGDVRISYKALPAGSNVTVFGLLNGSSLSRYTNAQNNSLYNLEWGDRNTAIATLHNQYETLTWILRGVGILMIWVGFMMLLGPLNILLDFLPIAGEISSGISLIITLPLALLIGGTVIIISYSLHHIIALIIGVPVVFLLGLGVLKLVKHTRGVTAASSQAPSISPSTTSNVASTSAVTPSSGSLFATPSVPAAPAPSPPPPAPAPPVAPIPITPPPLHAPGNIIHPEVPRDPLSPSAEPEIPVSPTPPTEPPQSPPSASL